MQYQKKNNGGQFQDWIPTSQPIKPINQYKIQNVPTGPASQSSTLKTNAKAWTPSFSSASTTSAPAPVPAPVPAVKKESDPLTSQLKKTTQSDDEIKKAKDIFAELKKSIDANKGVIDLAIFKKIGTLKICDTTETDADKLNYCTNPLMLKRETSKMVE